MGACDFSTVPIMLRCCIVSASMGMHYVYGGRLDKRPRLLLKLPPWVVAGVLWEKLGALGGTLIPSLICFWLDKYLIKRSFDQRCTLLN